MVYLKKKKTEPKPQRKVFHLKDTALLCDFQFLFVFKPMICFYHVYEYVNGISRKTISFCCKKAHHGCQRIGKHIIVVYSIQIINVYEYNFKVTGGGNYPPWEDVLQKRLRKTRINRNIDLMLGDCTVENVVIILPPPRLTGLPFGHVLETFYIIISFNWVKYVTMIFESQIAIIVKY